MIDKRVEEVNDVVGMYNIGVLGFVGGFGGIGFKGVDQVVNNDIDFGVVEESYVIEVGYQM